MEFLKNINYNFQIIVQNRKLNTEKYIRSLNKNINNNCKNFSLKNEYLNDVKNKIESENINVQDFYFAFKFENKIDSKGFISKLKHIENIGSKMSLVTGKNNILSIINRGINKEDFL